MEFYQAQAQAEAHLQRLHMAPLYPEMQMGAGFGQYHVSDRQENSTVAMALAISRDKQDHAALAWSFPYEGLAWIVGYLMKEQSILPFSHTGTTTFTERSQDAVKSRGEGSSTLTGETPMGPSTEDCVAEPNAGGS